MQIFNLSASGCFSVFSTFPMITPGNDNGALVNSASNPEFDSMSANSFGLSLISRNSLSQSIETII